MKNNKAQNQKLTSNDDIKKLMIERLRCLSSGTMISVGSSGDYTRDQMIEFVKEGNELGELFTKVQIEWLRSFQDLASIK